MERKFKTAFTAEADNKLKNLAKEIKFKRHHQYIPDITSADEEKYFSCGSDISNGESYIKDSVREKIIKYIRKNDFERDIENEKRPVDEEYIKLKDFLFDKGLNIYDESGNLKSVGEVVSEINKMWSCGNLSDEDIKVINKTRSEIQDRKLKDKGLDKESLLIKAEQLKRNKAIAYEKHLQEIRNMNMRITNWELPSKNVKQKTT